MPILLLSTSAWDAIESAFMSVLGLFTVRNILRLSLSSSTESMGLSEDGRFISCL